MKLSLPQLSGTFMGPAPEERASASILQPLAPNPQLLLSWIGMKRWAQGSPFMSSALRRGNTDTLASLTAGPLRCNEASPAQPFITPFLKCPLSLLPYVLCQAPLLSVHLSLRWMKVSDTRDTKEERKNNWKIKTWPAGKTNNSRCVSIYTPLIIYV